MWVTTAFPTAGEATIALVGSRARPRPGPARRSVRSVSAADSLGNRERVARRAAAQIRRYVVANGCQYLWTFTFGKHTDREGAVASWARFNRRLNREYPDVPWVRTLEQHKGGSFHLHAALNTRIPARRMRELWGHGHVFVAFRPARRTASYLAKALLTTPRPAGARTFESARRFKPARITTRHNDLAAARTQLSDLMGGPPDRVFLSSSWPGYAGPPAAALQWLQKASLAFPRARARGKGSPTPPRPESGRRFVLELSRIDDTANLMA